MIVTQTGEHRLQEYARLFATAFISRERTDTGMRWRLWADDGIEEWARDLAARENACCAFMTTTVTTTDGQVLWDSTTIDDPTAGSRRPWRGSALISSGHWC